MSSHFPCANCEHAIRRHQVKKWPQIALGCVDCGCLGYQFNNNTSRWDEDMEAGAIG